MIFHEWGSVIRANHKRWSEVWAAANAAHRPAPDTPADRAAISAYLNRQIAEARATLKRRAKR